MTVKVVNIKVALLNHATHRLLTYLLFDAGYYLKS